MSELSTYVASKLPTSSPWSTATILGWAALAVGTIVTVVIVVIAVTQP